MISLFRMWGKTDIAMTQIPRRTEAFPSPSLMSRLPKQCTEKFRCLQMAVHSKRRQKKRKYVSKQRRAKNPRIPVRSYYQAEAGTAWSSQQEMLEMEVPGACVPYGGG